MEDCTKFCWKSAVLLEARSHVSKFLDERDVLSLSLINWEHARQVQQPKIENPSAMKSLIQDEDSSNILVCSEDIGDALPLDLQTTA
jgi:hypothetical protein